MASPYVLSDNDLLTIGKRAIDNTLRASELLKAVTPYGYDEAALEEGRMLWSSFDTAVQIRREESGEASKAFFTTSSWVALICTPSRCILGPFKSCSRVVTMLPV